MNRKSIKSKGFQSVCAPVSMAVGLLCFVSPSAYAQSQTGVVNTLPTVAITGTVEKDYLGMV